jgi:hypothetical protein
LTLRDVIVENSPIVNGATTRTGGDASRRRCVCLKFRVVVGTPAILA